MKTWAPWLVIVVLVGGLFYIIDANRQAKAVLKAQLEKAAEENAALAAQIADLASRVGQSEAARIAGAEAAARREVAFLAELAKVGTATPQQLIDDGARLLRAVDITLSTDGKVVSVGLETWRGAVTLMLVGDEYLREKKPAWEAQARGYADTIALLKEQATAYERQVRGLEATVESLSKATISKGLKTWERILWAGAGLAAGMIVEKAIR